MKKDEGKSFALETYFQTLVERQQQEPETKRLLIATTGSTIRIHMKNERTILGQVLEAKETLAIIKLNEPLVLENSGITITQVTVMYDGIDTIDMTKECLATMIKW